MPIPSATIHYNSTILRHPALILDEIVNLLTQIIAMNGHSAAAVVREKPNVEAISESSPISLASNESSKSSELSEPTSESPKSTSSSVDDTDLIQIPHPVITHSPLQAKLPQPATEHLDPD